ncbi:MAG TPA: YoaK family protein [Casimicrobiaceae bacterium]|nr:YoaK family protein [Casimicrobiaceae bacterium]
MVAPSQPANVAVAAKDEREGSLLPLLFVLTVVTGLVDAVSYLKLGHVFVANMTGNVVFLGFAVAGAPGFSIPASLIAIGAFLAGALAGGRLASSMPEHRTRLVAIAVLVKLVLVGVALVVAITTTDLDAAPVQYGLIALLALAMGLQNAAARVLAVPDLTTTVLTLTLTGLAADSTPAGGSNPRAGRRLLATGAMFLGAAIGAFLVLNIGMIAALALTFTVLAFNAIAAYRLWSQTRNAQPSSP